VDKKQVVILSIGSRGDVQPCIALALGLQQSGYLVRLVSHAEYKTLAREHGVEEYFQLRGNPQALLQDTPEGQAFLQSGTNPFTIGKIFLAAIGDLMDPLLADSLRASEDADIILFSPLAFFGHYIAEKLGIPSAAVPYLPIIRTRAFPMFLAPTWLKLGGTYNYLSWRAGEQAFWMAIRGIFNTWRREVLHLEIGRGGLFDHINGATVIHSFSSHLIPRPQDWPERHHVTGFWYLDHPRSWIPPQEVVDFLADGPKPIYIGFGSMVPPDRELATARIVEALQMSGQRGVIAPGWGKLRSKKNMGDILQIDSLPHDWLFPQMAAVIHHGGAGTTAAGARAGVPTVIVPFFGDQPFWGEVITKAGVGPQPLPFKQLTAAKLAERIILAVSDVKIQQTASDLGRRIRREAGVHKAVEIIGGLLDRAAPSSTT